MLPEATKTYLEEALQSQMTGIRQELKYSNLRAIRLESQLRDNRNQIARLNIELNRSKENEQGLHETVRKLIEKSSELQEKCSGLNSETLTQFKFKTDNLEAVLALWWDEMGVLRSDLETEKKCKVEAERKLAEIISKFEKRFVELQEQNLKLEQRIVEAERGMVTQRSTQRDTENGVVAVIDQLGSEFRANLEEWKKKQLVLEEQLGRMRDAFAELKRRQDVQVPPMSSLMMNQVPPTPPSSASVSTSTPSTSTTWINTTPTCAPNFNGNGQTMTAPIPVTMSKKDLDHGDDPSDPHGLRCICGGQHKTKHSLAEHIQYYTREWKFSCTICLKPFWEYNKLSKHMGAVHGINLPEGRYGCRTCGLIVTSREELGGHRKFCNRRGTGKMGASKGLMAPAPVAAPLNVNNGKAIQTPNLTTLKRKPRPIIPRKINFQHRRDFNQGFGCHCGKTFSDNRGLGRHLKYYTAQKFSCKHCGQRFPYAFYLRKHLLRTHTSEMSPSSQSQLQSQTKHHSFLLHSLTN